MSDKTDGPVVGDDNFVNVDPDFANYSNDVDKPLPQPEVEDFNLPEWAREEKNDDEESDEKAEVKTEAPKVSSPAITPAAQTAK